jgi:hypothetical protein
VYDFVGQIFAIHCQTTGYRDIFMKTTAAVMLNGDFSLDFKDLYK